MSLEALQGRVPRHSSQLASEDLILIQPENRANTGLRDLARSPVTPNSGTAGSPLQICLLPLCPHPAISLKDTGKTEHVHACHDQPSHFNCIPNHGLSNLPHVLLTPALLAGNLLSHRMCWCFPVLQNLPSILQVLPVTNFPSIFSTLTVQWFKPTSYNLFFLSC